MQKQILANNSCRGKVVMVENEVIKSIITFDKFIHPQDISMFKVTHSDGKKYLGTIPGRVYMRVIDVNNQRDDIVEDAKKLVDKKYKKYGKKNHHSFNCLIDETKYDLVKDTFKPRPSFIDRLNKEMPYFFEKLGEEFKVFYNSCETHMFVPNMSLYPILENNENHKIVFDIFLKKNIENITKIQESDIPILKRIIINAKHLYYDILKCPQDRYDIKVKIRLDQRDRTLFMLTYAIDKNVYQYKKFTEYYSSIDLENVINKICNGDKISYLSRVYSDEDIVDKLCKGNIEYERSGASNDNIVRRYYLTNIRYDNYKEILRKPIELDHKCIIDGYMTKNSPAYCSEKVIIMSNDDKFKDVFIKDITYDILRGVVKSKEAEIDKIYESMMSKKGLIYTDMINRNIYNYISRIENIDVEVSFVDVFEAPIKVLPISILETPYNYERFYNNLSKYESRLDIILVLQQWYVNILWSKIPDKTKMYKIVHIDDNVEYYKYHEHSENVLFENIPLDIDTKELKSLLESNKYADVLFKITFYVSDDFFSYNRYNDETGRIYDDPSYLMWGRIKMKNIGYEKFSDIITYTNNIEVSKLKTIQDDLYNRFDLLEFVNSQRDNIIPSKTFPTDMRHMTPDRVNAADNLYKAIYHDAELFNYSHLRYMNYPNSDANSVLHINIVSFDIFTKQNKFGRALKSNRVEELLGRMKIWEHDVINVDHTKRTYMNTVPLKVKYGKDNLSDETISEMLKKYLTDNSPSRI